MPKANRASTHSAAMLVLLLAAMACDVAPRPVAAATPATLTGRLSTHEGLPVLELWGTREQAAYAEGYLLAESFVSVFDDYIFSEQILPQPLVYENALIPAVRRQFVWPEDTLREVEALMAGARERLGGPPRSKVLERDLTADDVLAANALADWFGLFCTAMTVWGPLSADGQPLTARNLDFPYTPAMAQAQIVKIRRAADRRRARIEVGWPGAIGVYTAMNADGVCIFMNDANGLAPSHAVGFTPRALTLREALETARPESYLQDIERVLRSRRVLVGNNILVSGPLRDGDAPPAAVFEYDANDRTEGVTTRLPAAGRAGAASALWCTNHLRARREPVSCNRYDILETELAALSEAGRGLSPAAAIELIRKTRQRMTLHTVCTQPHERRMFVHIPAIADRVVEFRLDEWLGRPVPGSPAAGAKGVGAAGAP